MRASPQWWLSSPPRRNGIDAASASDVTALRLIADLQCGLLTDGSNKVFAAYAI
jgi:hypothetical protein